MERYLLTGYNKKDKKMATHVYTKIQHVADVINQLEQQDKDASKQDELPIKSVKDLDFNVQSRASHLGAQIICTKNYCWSVFYLK